MRRVVDLQRYTDQMMRVRDRHITTDEAWGGSAEMIEFVGQKIEFVTHIIRVRDKLLTDNR